LAKLIFSCCFWAPSLPRSAAGLNSKEKLNFSETNARAKLLYHEANEACAKLVLKPENNFEIGGHNSFKDEKDNSTCSIVYFFKQKNQFFS